LVPVADILAKVMALSATFAVVIALLAMVVTAVLLISTSPDAVWEPEENMEKQNWLNKPGLLLFHLIVPLLLHQ
jgi:hypothetical protein